MFTKKFTKHCYIAFAILISFTLICLIERINNNYSVKKITNIEDVKNICHLSYPKDTLLVDAYYKKGLSPYMFTQTQMSARGVELFLLQFPHSARDTKFSDLPDDPRLKDKRQMLHMVANFIAINANQSPRTFGTGYVSILVDLDRSKYRTVYIFWRN